jgi:hypothetical protein
VATRPATVTDRIGVTSTSMPMVEEWPAKLCPPLRAASLRPCRRANEIASATSSRFAQDRMAAGRRSWKRALNGGGDVW